MGKRRNLVVGVAVLALVGWVGPAPAPEAQAADCTFVYDLLLSPGIGAKPSSGPLRTEGKTGKFNCRGYKGDTGFDGRYGTAGPVTCASGGEGAGKLSYRMGWQDQEQDVRFTFGAIKDGKVSGSFSGDGYNGTYTFTATEGNCGGAITKGRLEGELTRAG
jgi:hypothetical protein